MSLNLLDWSAQLRTRSSLLLVDSLETCQMNRSPRAGEIVARARIGERLRVREVGENQATLCYRVELDDGRRGWVPWHEEYLRSDGFDISLRFF